MFWLRKATILVAMVVLFGACRDTQRKLADDAAGAPANPVQNEMRQLHESLRDVVTAVSNGNVSSVPESLHKVHAAREKTALALKAASYKPPKNADKLDQFEELDEAFHGDLEKLVDAATSGDVAATGRALGPVMASCQGCHQQFRF